MKILKKLGGSYSERRTANKDFSRDLKERIVKITITDLTLNAYET